jgi:hypothetical protein
LSGASCCYAEREESRKTRRMKCPVKGREANCGNFSGRRITPTARTPNVLRQRRNRAERRLSSRCRRRHRPVRWVGEGRSRPSYRRNSRQRPSWCAGPGSRACRPGRMGYSSRLTKTLLGLCGQSLAGVATTASSSAAVRESWMVNRVMSTPPATSPSVSRLAIGSLRPGHAAAECATLRVRASHVGSMPASSGWSAQDLVQMQPRLSAPAEVAVQNRRAMASC